MVTPGPNPYLASAAMAALRSATGTCESERPEVTAGGATYRLSVELGEAKSESDAAFLLN